MRKEICEEVLQERSMDRCWCEGIAQWIDGDRLVRRDRWNGWYLLVKKIGWKQVVAVVFRYFSSEESDESPSLAVQLPG